MISKVALFALNERVFALPVEGIMHIVPTPQIFPLPLLRQGVGGVFLYQGEVIPLFDLWRTFGMTAPAAPPSGQYTVVFGTESGLVGLPADQVVRIVNREQGAMEEAADEDQPAGLGRLFLCAGRRYPLLDIEALVTSLPR